MQLKIMRFIADTQAMNDKTQRYDRFGAENAPDDAYMSWEERNKKPYWEMDGHHEPVGLRSVVHSHAVADRMLDEAKALIEELCDLVADPSYQADSFTCQPAETWLERLASIRGESSAPEGWDP